MNKATPEQLRKYMADWRAAEAQRKAFEEAERARVRHARIANQELTFRPFANLASMVKV